MNKYQYALNGLINQNYDDIEVLQELVDKEIPVKPEYISLLTSPPQQRTRCGNCSGAHLEKVFKFCPYCGKVIDWDNNEKE